MSRAELNELLGVVLPFAREMLAKYGEFYPFAAALDAEGKVNMVAGHTGDERPAPAALRTFLEGALQQAARQGLYKATALCFNATFTPSGRAPLDVVTVELEHQSGEAVNVHLPYEGTVGEMRYGELFASAAGPKVFRPET